MVQDILKYLLQHKEDLLKLSIHYSLLPLMDLINPEGLFSYFTRFDVIAIDQGNKFIEINSDTPVGYLETAVGKWISLGLKNANNDMRAAITRAWDKIIEKDHILPTDIIYFTSYEWYEEDRLSTMFNMQHCHGV